MGHSKNYSTLPRGGEFYVSKGAPKTIAKQRGPTCGIYALEAVLACHVRNLPPATKRGKEEESLRRVAKTQGLTQIGELFDVRDVVALAALFDVQADVVKVDQFTFFPAIKKVVDAGNVALVPFCQKDGQPVKSSDALDAHWCIAVGYYHSAVPVERLVLVMQYEEYYDFNAIAFQESNACIPKWAARTWGKPAKDPVMKSYEPLQDNVAYSKQVLLKEVDLSVTLANQIVVI